MPEPIVTDPFDAELEARLADWRNVAPPAFLKARIAAEIRPRPALPWRPVLAGAIAIAAAGGYLLWPGSPVRPLPVFAEIERTMGTVESLSYVSTMDTTYRDGTVEHQTGRNWVRRNPPAVVDESIIRYRGKEMREKTMDRGGQEIRLDERTNRSQIRSRPRKDLTLQVERMLFVYTRPGSDDESPLSPANRMHWDISPWSTERGLLEGKAVWIFRRTVRHLSEGAPTPREVSTIRVWAEPATRHVVRCEVRSTIGTGEIRQIVNTDFHYNEPPPSGLAPDLPTKSGS